MKGKILAFIAIPLLISYGNIFAYTCTFNNKTSYAVEIEFDAVGKNSPRMTVAGHQQDVKWGSGIKLLHGIRIHRITLPNGVVINTNEKGTPNYLTEYHRGGRACGFTWDLTVEQRIERKMIGGLYSDIPVAAKFSLYRHPCGPGGSAYPGGVQRTTGWISLQ